MKKTILFIGPTIANIYLDIIAEMERQEYIVDFYEYKSYKKDPHNLKGHRKYGKIFTPEYNFQKYIKRVWENLLSQDKYSKAYDFLFVIDGDSFHPVLFDTLRNRNPNVKCINYLFDTTRSNYEFNVHFPYFDKVYTFDIQDSKTYNLPLLPIYWIDNNGLQKVKESNDFFGMGTYIPERFTMFSKIKEYADKRHMSSDIRLYTPILNNKLKHTLKKIFIECVTSRYSYMIPLSHYNAEIITHEFMSPSDYRLAILKSKFILDSNAPHQDGLTARFMWALGAGKKIITTNKAVRNYDFYSPNQIYVIDDIDKFVNEESFSIFVRNNYFRNSENLSGVIKYRIDNWIKLLIS